MLANERGVKRVESFATADRHALVIGNSAYNHISPLRNPVNDTQSMTISLQSLGFRVTTLTDSDQRGMDQAICQFGKIPRRLMRLFAIRSNGDCHPVNPPNFGAGRIFGTHQATHSLTGARASLSG